MTKEELDRLETVAKAATQGDWGFTTFEVYPSEHFVECDGGCDDEGAFVCGRATHDGQVICETFGLSQFAERDAEHIAAFDPPTALALIARVRELEEWELETVAMNNEIDGLHQIIKSLEASRDAWREAAEVAEQIEIHDLGDCHPMHDCVMQRRNLKDDFEASLIKARALDEQKGTK